GLCLRALPRLEDDARPARRRPLGRPAAAARDRPRARARAEPADSRRADRRHTAKRRQGDRRRHQPPAQRARHDGARRRAKAAVRAALLRSLLHHGQGPRRRERHHARAHGRARAHVSLGLTRVMDLPLLDHAFSSGWLGAVVLGLWFGTLHALDADHVATVGGIAIGNRSVSPVEYALRWAAGHAAALGAIALAAVALGVSTATALSLPAEVLVATALVAIGAHVVWAVPHRRRSASSRSKRAGVVLGVLHGTAGSAVVLALLPIAQFGGALASALYLVCFSLGVAAGAVAFAALFSRFAARAAAAGAAAGTCLQLVVGAFALVSGALILVGMSVGHGGG